MSEYIFRFPADTPKLSYAGLTAATDHGAAVRGIRWLPIGSTAHVRAAQSRGEDYFILRLYDTDIAHIFHDRVAFPKTDDTHRATREWLAKVVRDNGLGSNVWRERRRKSDGPGPYEARGMAGVLVIDGNREKPVEGRTYLALRRLRTAPGVREGVARLAEARTPAVAR